MTEQIEMSCIRAACTGGADACGKANLMDQYAEVYEKLADHLDRLPEGYPRTPSGVEIRILRRLFTPEQAALAQLVTLMPEPPGAIASRSGLDPAETALKLEEMSLKGLIFRYPQRTRSPIHGRSLHGWHLGVPRKRPRCGSHQRCARIHALFPQTEQPV